MIIYYSTGQSSDCTDDNAVSGSRRSRALFQKMIREHLALPEKTVILRSAGGKPFFAGYPEISFSITHTGSVWLCAVAGRPVGIDAEFLTRRISDPVELAERFLHPQETAWIANGSLSGVRDQTLLLKQKISLPEKEMAASTPQHHTASADAVTDSQDVVFPVPGGNPEEGMTENVDRSEEKATINRPSDAIHRVLSEPQNRDAERRILSQGNPEWQVSRFFDIWTRKEAALKLFEQGVFQNSDQFSVLSETLPARFLRFSVDVRPCRSQGTLLVSVSAGKNPFSETMIGGNGGTGTSDAESSWKWLLQEAGKVKWVSLDDPQ